MFESPAYTEALAAVTSRLGVTTGVFFTFPFTCSSLCLGYMTG